MMHDSYRNWILIVARFLLATLFVISGYGKLMAFDGTVAFVAEAGVPMASLAVALTILIELVGGILLMLGWKTRLAALSLLSFTVVATAVFHSNIMEQAQQVAFLKNVSIVGGLLYAHLFGPGRLSIDERTSGSGMET